MTVSWLFLYKGAAMRFGQGSRIMSRRTFRNNVDFLVEFFMLDPNLPEVANLKEQAKKIVSQGAPGPFYYLRMLDPTHYVSEHRGVKVLAERQYGHVLQAWSLARHHCPQLDEELVRIFVDRDGAHLFALTEDREVFCVQGAAINPHRLGDPGNRYEIACVLIRELTGVPIDYRDHVGSTRTITVTKGADGAWQVEFDSVSSVAG